MRRRMRLVLLAGLVCGALCAAGCGKREAARRLAEPQVTNEVPGVATYAKKRADGADKACVVAESDGATEGYVAALEEQQKVLAALDYARTPGATLEVISNMLAGVTSKDIMAVVVPLQRNSEYDDEDTRAIMKVYEVVRARGEPGWAVLFCVSKLSEYSRESMTEEGYAKGLEMLREARLSESPCDSEKATFAGIQLDLLLALSHVPEEQYEQILRIERMREEGVVEFPEQPLQYMITEKAYCLYYMGRDREADALMSGLYERYLRGELADSLDCVFERGLEAAIESTRAFAKANREIYDKRKAGKAFWE